MKHKTTREIRKALCTLLLQKEIEKITVAEICAEAEINRGTFYRYYHDIYEVREEVENNIVQEIYDRALKLLDKKEGMEKVLIIFLRLISEQNRLLWSLILHGHSQLAKKISEILMQYAVKNHLLTDNLDENKKEYAYIYLHSGIIGIITAWGRNGFSESAEEIAQIIIELSKNVLQTENKAW